MCAEEIEEGAVSVALLLRNGNNFKYHAPKKGQNNKYEELRRSGRELADKIAVLCPPNARETEVAILKIEEAIMWANASIARGGVNDKS